MRFNSVNQLYAFIVEFAKHIFLTTVRDTIVAKTSFEFHLVIALDSSNVAKSRSFNGELDVISLINCERTSLMNSSQTVLKLSAASISCKGSDRFLKKPLSEFFFAQSQSLIDQFWPQLRKLVSHKL